MLNPPTFLHNASQFMRGSIGAHNVERTAGASVFEGGIQRLLAVIDQTEPVLGNLSIFQAHREFFRLVATAYRIQEGGRRWQPLHYKHCACRAKEYPARSLPRACASLRVKDLLHPLPTVPRWRQYPAWAAYSHSWDNDICQDVTYKQLHRAGLPGSGRSE